MSKADKTKPAAISIGDLYPSLHKAELREAEENLDRYLALVVRIHERIEAEPPGHVAVAGLTSSRPEVGSEAQGRTAPQPNKTATST